MVSSYLLFCYYSIIPINITREKMGVGLKQKLLCSGMLQRILSWPVLLLFVQTSIDSTIVNARFSESSKV